MSLGVAFKGPEGVVLAADSRVTLMAMRQVGPHEAQAIPATFDNATKLLQLQSQKFVGAVTYGLGALGVQEPRTAHSFLPEFEEELLSDPEYADDQGRPVRISVRRFSELLSDFFMRQWRDTMPEDYGGEPLIFLVGGYDEDSPYGSVYQMTLPYQPTPVEQNANQFGATWGGQLQIVNRIMHGHDPALVNVAERALDLTPEQAQTLAKSLQDELRLPIPYQFLPLQDCVDLAIFLVRTTMELQTWQVEVRGVGGAIDVATITRTEGFEPVQVKSIQGEDSFRTRRA